MTGARVTITPDSVPRLPRGVRFRYDQARSAWIVLAPERIFMPDETAVEVLKLVDGQASVAAIAEILAQRFAAPAAEIAGDVVEMLQDLADKGVLDA
jgi:pyrroloquinoline quinone biosynthesis protein D